MFCLFQYIKKILEEKKGLMISIKTNGAMVLRGFHLQKFIIVSFGKLFISK
jgi:hypothetical protein